MTREAEVSSAWKVMIRKAEEIFSLNSSTKTAPASSKMIRKAEVIFNWKSNTEAVSASSRFDS